MIDTDMWDDEYVDSLSPDGKLLFFYFLTNLHTNLAGCYKITRKRMHINTGLEYEVIDDLLTAFENDEKVMYRDGRLLVRNFIDHQKMGNEKIKKGVLNLLPDFPEWCIDTLSIDYPELCIGHTYPTVYLDSDSDSDLDFDSEENQDDGKAADKAKTAEAKKELQSQIDVIFAYWQATLKKERHTLTDQRSKAIAARLKKYSVDQILRAIDGCACSPHHMGNNDTGTEYNDIELICRNDTKLEGFIEKAEKRVNGNGTGKQFSGNGSNPTPGERIANRPYR